MVFPTGEDNACYRQKVVINEININHEVGYNQEFIELYDGGIGLTPLTGIILVIYNSTDSENMAERVITLSNTQTNK